jgi:hypothetical protein
MNKVAASRITMTGSGPLGEGHANGGRTMEEYDYKCTEDLEYDI